MKKLFILASITISACSHLDSTSFESKNYDYSDLSKNPPIKEVRVFSIVDQTGKCPLQSTKETPQALVISAIGWLAKEAIAYGKSELEARAQYLESDIKLNGRALLVSDWPVNPAKKEGLCLLLVAGKFEATPNTPALDAFRAHVQPNTVLDGEGGFRETMSDYQLQIPGAEPIANPFTGLTGNPDFLMEVRVTPKTVGGTLNFVVSPTYMLYPHPLHKMTFNGPKRKLTVDLGLGDSKAALALDDFQSGHEYTASSLKTRYALASSASGKPFGALSFVVTEGPDALPTAKALRAVAEKTDDLNKIVDEKVQAALAKEAAAKKPAKP
ncbi:MULTISPECIES: hypothetical protein [unclassified Pseudomonas]|uniref:hypothetical protein n=1 Tax=unclassified Pseudomonas TaxID=196821 RepID=UPI00111C8416|nr:MULTISPECIES: hypothetical protein [unclassified Pseudomonas]